MSVTKQKVSDSSGISCHAWNGARTKVAICPYTNEVHVYEADESGYKLLATLKEHEQLVSGIDWSPKKDFIVTCAHDRNAYVWEQSKEEGKWEPQMTILPSNFNRAALCVQWSPKENKFALGGGSKAVAVCYYQEENNWWISKLIRKKHNSSVTCVKVRVCVCVCVSLSPSFFFGGGGHFPASIPFQVKDFSSLLLTLSSFLFY